MFSTISHGKRPVGGRTCIYLPGRQGYQIAALFRLAGRSTDAAAVVPGLAIRVDLDGFRANGRTGLHPLNKRPACLFVLSLFAMARLFWGAEECIVLCLDSFWVAGSSTPPPALLKMAVVTLVSASGILDKEAAIELGSTERPTGITHRKMARIMCDKQRVFVAGTNKYQPADEVLLVNQGRKRRRSD